MTDTCDTARTLAALGRSPFRRKFRLSPADRAFVRESGLEQVLEEARIFVSARLGPAEPVNEGRQTPFRGHPVSVAQHGTATCCRRCLQKWHHIPAGRRLLAAEEDYIVRVIGAWLQSQMRPQRGSAVLTAATA
ncbi:MAG: DUF4186 domain-containing protein [Herminiimonas sp.]|nr:DUF4186 domain-containing protein [Herminiimonas sp.]